MHSGFSSCHYCGAPQIHSSEKEARELRKFTDQVVSNNFLQKSSFLHLTGRYCEFLYKSMCFCPGLAKGPMVHNKPVNLLLENSIQFFCGFNKPL